MMSTPDPLPRVLLEQARRETSLLGLAEHPEREKIVR